MPSGTLDTDGLRRPPPADCVLTQDDVAGLAHAVTTPGRPVRLPPLSMVTSADDVCSCNLEDPLGGSRSTTSHLTRFLVGVGLIRGEKQGPTTW